MTVTRDSHVTGGVTFAVSHSTPSRPVPTRPISLGRAGLSSPITSTSKFKSVTREGIDLDGKQ